MVTHLKHLKQLGGGQYRDVQSCNGLASSKLAHSLTDDIDLVTCVYCFYIWHHPEVDYCNEEFVVEQVDAGC